MRESLYVADVLVFLRERQLPCGDKTTLRHTSPVSTMSIPEGLADISNLVMVMFRNRLTKAFAEGTLANNVRRHESKPHEHVTIALGLEVFGHLLDG